MSSTIRFMNSGIGRSVRFLLGVGLIVYGLFGLGSVAGTLVAVIGLAPIALAGWGHCLIEPFTPHSRPTA
ncbi:MAG TPA: YgaP-like transmembrane domain [Ktedonobacterales bacterium]|nr:YgaP-like transmembrane domain [Ktedonobacterales bacterium]